MASTQGMLNRSWQSRLTKLQALPFPDGWFDAAFEHAVLMYIKDSVEASKEALRVLKPGGLRGAGYRLRRDVLEWGSPHSRA